MTKEALFVERKEIPYIWHEVSPLIEKALVHAEGSMLTPDVLSLLLDGTECLFIGKKDYKIYSALVGEIVSYPRKRIFRIVTWSTESGYDMEEWINLLHVIEDYARSHFCTELEAWTRKGLARKLKWDNEYSVITKKL